MKMSFCPEDGPGIDVDEDGCCIHCGCTAVGAWVDRMLLAVRDAADNIDDGDGDFALQHLAIIVPEVGAL